MKSCKFGIFHSSNVSSFLLIMFLFLSSVSALMIIPVTKLTSVKISDQSENFDQVEQREAIMLDNLMINSSFNYKTSDDFSFDAVQTHDGGYALVGLTNYFTYEEFEDDNGDEPDLPPVRIPISHADVLLVKLSSNGTVEWFKTYGGSNFDSAYALIQTYDHGFALAGSTRSNSLGRPEMLLIKTDLGGDMEWNRTFGTEGNDGAYDLIQSKDKGFVLVGYLSQPDEVLIKQPDMWLVKTDARGEMVWNRTFGGSKHDIGYTLVQTFDNGFAVLGATGFLPGPQPSGKVSLVKTDSNGEKTWNITYGAKIIWSAKTLVQTPDDGFIFACSTDSFDYGMWNGDVLLIKTSSNGSIEWTQIHGGVLADAANSLILTSDGGFAFAGFTGGEMFDMWLVKTDARGRLEWKRTYGGRMEDKAYTVIQTDRSSYILAGITSSYSHDGQDIWLINDHITPDTTKIISGFEILVILCGIFIIPFCQKKDLSNQERS